LEGSATKQGVVNLCQTDRQQVTEKLDTIYKVVLVKESCFPKLLNQFTGFGEKLS
jgi:hypothetical protein